MIGKCHTQDSVLVRCLKHKDEMQRHTIIHAIERYCYIVYMKTTGNGYVLIYHTKLDIQPMRSMWNLSMQEESPREHGGFSALSVKAI